jgi:hypothetical protein
MSGIFKQGDVVRLITEDYSTIQAGMFKDRAYTVRQADGPYAPMYLDGVEKGFQMHRFTLAEPGMTPASTVENAAAVGGPPTSQEQESFVQAVQEALAAPEPGTPETIATFITTGEPVTLTPTPLPEAIPPVTQPPLTVTSNPGLTFEEVNHPDHYSRWDMEPIEFIAVNDLPWWLANVVKYCMRYDAKDGLADMYKSRSYLEMKIRQLEGHKRFWEQPVTTERNLNAPKV